MTAWIDNQWTAVKPFCFEVVNKINYIECGSGGSVIVAQDAFDEVQQFLKLDVKREHGGFLLGGIIEGAFQTHNFATFVDSVIPCPKASGSMGYLTFNHDCWQTLYQHPGIRNETKSIVGWFHSHPGMTLKMSKKDIFIQSEFFEAEWQIAWIFDPINNKHAIYSLAESKINSIGNIGLVDGCAK